jgi:predicted metal-binding protein
VPPCSSQENDKLAKELAKLEKRCMEVRNTIDRREKEIEEAFESWEKKQFRKKLEEEQRAPKKGDKCVIY